MSFIWRFVRIVAVVDLSGGGHKEHYPITFGVLAGVILVLKGSDIDRFGAHPERGGTALSGMSNGK